MEVHIGLLAGLFCLGFVIGLLAGVFATLSAAKSAIDRHSAEVGEKINQLRIEAGLKP